MSDNRKRVLEKIEKLLNLGKDARGNPNECATALRQAQALMRKHNVTETELGAIGFVKESVNTTVQVNQKTVPVRISYLAALMKKAFGVRPVINHTVRVSDANYTIDYLGPRDRVMLAVYSHTVVMRALDAAWKQYLEDNPQMRGKRGFRAGFETAWIDAVSEQVEAMGFTEEETEGINALIAVEYGALVKNKHNNMKVSIEASIAGAEAGSQFQLNRPVARENLKIGN